MAENVTVEKVETNVAVEAVTKADNKVKQIEAEKTAKRKVRQDKRANWKGPLKLIGKAINYIEDHPVATTVSVLAGVPIGVVGVVAYEKFVKKSDDGTDEVTEEETNTEIEADEPPFDAEA